MDKKMLTIIGGILLIVCFFLPYISGFVGNVSGYDMVFGKMNPEKNWEMYLWVLIPFSGLMLVLGALNNGKYILGRALFCWLPLLTIIYEIVRAKMESGGEFMDMIKTWGYGLWVSLVISLILIFYNPRPRTV